MRRHAVLTAGTLFAAAVSGCASLDRSGTAQPPPIAAKPAQAITLAEIIDQHNANAQATTGFRAKPSITVRGVPQVVAATGVMAVERPRNFRLKLRAGVNQEVADIGSNDEMFWVWLRDRKDRKVYAAHYDASGSAGNVLAFQPDWVIEALGLREIPPEEEANITSQRSQDAATLTLVHHRYDADGAPTRKETIVNAETGRVLRHRFYRSDNPKTLLAQATVSEYKRFPASSSSSETVSLPTRIKIDWYQPGSNPIVLEVTLGEPDPGRLDRTEQLSLFEMPRKPGYEVVWMNEAPRLEPTSRSRARGSAPASVRLGEPEGLSDASSARLDADTVSASADPSADPRFGPAPRRRSTWFGGAR